MENVYIATRDFKINCSTIEGVKISRLVIFKDDYIKFIKDMVPRNSVFEYKGDKYISRYISNVIDSGWIIEIKDEKLDEGDEINAEKEKDNKDKVSNKSSNDLKSSSDSRDTIGSDKELGVEIPEEENEVDNDSGDIDKVSSEGDDLSDRKLFGDDIE